MRRKTANNQTKINGFYINEFIRGFLGDQNEGKKMLKIMELPSDEIPFSAGIFLRNKRIFWLDKQGNKATISFKIKPNQLECFGTYKKKRRSIRLFREWSACEDPEMVARLESEAIGDCCMKCIYENLIV